MGYSELVCQICGASFNIGRIRHVGEPPEASWVGDKTRPRDREEYDPEPYGAFITHGTYPHAQHCSDRGGCMTVIPDDWSDLDYVYQPMDIDPFELETPRETDDDDSDDDMVDSDTDDQALGLYASFKAALAQKDDRRGVPLDMQPVGQEVQTFHRDEIDEREHIAGIYCTHLGGYNGNHISLEEMRGCRTLQCLVPKPTPGWRSQADDQDFELQDGCNFFLSGLCDYVPSRDEATPTVFPQRHACDTPYADNCFWDENSAADTAMPFHPTCFEVYKRVCLRQSGKIDAQGLVDWYRLEASFDVRQNIPRDPAVRKANGQWWEHHEGDEFLAANPCFVPGLRPLLDSAKARSTNATDFHRGVFDVADSRALSDDFFSRLPLELRLHVLLYLGSKDIASLRLATRAFQQLPQSLFHSLLLREAPWLWEAWRPPIPSYSFWATVTGDELLDESKKWEHVKMQFRQTTELLEAEAVLPNENDVAIAALQASLRDQAIEREEREVLAYRNGVSVPGPSLSLVQTDWYGLYLDITKKWGQLKGLRNRERVWKDCEEILYRIDRYRASGQIGPGIDVDARVTARTYRERQYAKHDTDGAWANYCAAGKPGWPDGFVRVEWASKDPNEM